MKEVVKLLFAKSLDLKGSIPSFSTDLKSSFNFYSKIKASKWEWVLSRLVLNYDEVETGGTLSTHQSTEIKPIPITVSIPATSNYKEFKNYVSIVERDLINIHNQRLGELKTEVIEAIIPLDSIRKESTTEMIKSLDFIVERMVTNKIFPHKTYFQIPDHQVSVEKLKLVLKVIARHNSMVSKRGLQYYSESGFKYNIDSEADEKAVKLLAAVILFTRDLGLELMFSCSNSELWTSAKEVEEKQSPGIINILAACMLSYSCDLRASEVIQILNDTERGHFELSDKALKWKDFIISGAEVKMLRNVAFPSFAISDFKTAIEGIARL